MALEETKLLNILSSRVKRNLYSGLLPVAQFCQHAHHFKDPCIFIAFAMSLYLTAMW